MTEIVCDIGHCKQSHAQTGTCEGRRERGEDKLTLQGELNNKTNSNEHTHQQEQVEGIAVEEMCHVGRGKSFRSQSGCCKAIVDTHKDILTLKKRKQTTEHAHQRTAHDGVGHVVKTRTVAVAWSEAAPSTTDCCGNITNTQEDSHKLARGQEECKHANTHIMHIQGIDATSEKKALDKGVRSTTSCCRDGTDAQHNTHKQAQSQKEWGDVYQHVQHIQSVGAGGGRRLRRSVRDKVSTHTTR